MKDEVAQQLRSLMDPLAVAAEAVVAGRGLEADWDTLAAISARDGVDAVAARLAALAHPEGPGFRWWRCSLLLSMELPAPEALALANELIEIEGLGEGPPFDPDRHALEVSAAVRFLQDHLQRVLAGLTDAHERRCVAAVVRAAQLARAQRAGRS